jgi:hypothetical protein
MVILKQEPGARIQDSEFRIQEHPTGKLVKICEETHLVSRSCRILEQSGLRRAMLREYLALSCFSPATPELL